MGIQTTAQYVEKTRTLAQAAAMQKSKSSSSVMHHGSRLVAKKIFRSRSKSQTRVQNTPSTWTPQGGCVWTNVTGRQVTLGDTSLLQLSDVERRVLQKVALAKLQALNLGVTVRIPSDTVAHTAQKSKRRAYLLKRKAKTTGFFDTGRKEDKDKDGNSTTGLVFGIPLSQCIENDRLSRIARAGSPFRSRGELSGDENATLRRQSHHGSRASFSSLIDSPRTEESGSCESLMSRERIAGSVPGLLDSLSCGSTTDIASATAAEEELGIPHMVTACLRYLETRGLHTLGIFRVSSSKKRVRQLREDFDCGKETSLEDEQCPHDIATLLKEYLRDLPDPLLCRDLYHAFVQTQRIRNRRLQLEAIQHLIQLLPVPNRDTLSALLTFLSNVARNSNDIKDSSGEWITGNKMDSNNLATVFAPNILHCLKPTTSSKDSNIDRPEDRIDVINVIRTMIDHNRQLLMVPAELLDEVYVYMMDIHPEALDTLLNKRDAASLTDAELLDDGESESNSAPWTPTTNTEMPLDPVMLSLQASGDYDGRNTSSEPRKTWSREEFLHENAGTGGPNVAMRLRERDRGRERLSKKRWRDDSTIRKKLDDANSNSGMSSAMTIITRFRSQKDDDASQLSKTRSSSVDSNSSVQNDGNDVNARLLRVASDDHYNHDRRQSSPILLDNSGVITASLKIPVQTSQQAMSLNLDDSDIPYIEDSSGYGYLMEGSKQQMTIGLVRTPTVPPRRRQRSLAAILGFYTTYIT
ncbi:Rho GTPase activating protein at 102A [Carabus blaptoides fortunei]